jgi:hypothetical protein
MQEEMFVSKSPQAHLGVYHLKRPDEVAGVVLRSTQTVGL